MTTKLNVNQIKKIIQDENPTSIDRLKDIVAQRLEIYISRSALHRFMKANDIVLESKFIKNEELYQNISEIVSRCGPYYGRKTIKGALASQGIHASQRRISVQLRQINPQNHIRRALNIHRQLNPRRYRAPYFGYNLHLDQNEKLKDYGCVIVLAVDGKSNFLAAGLVIFSTGFPKLFFKKFARLCYASQK